VICRGIRGDTVRHFDTAPPRSQAGIDAVDSKDGLAGQFESLLRGFSPSASE
jgi:hypothetical protein